MNLHIEGLTKRYGHKLALDSFSTELSNGIYALLGPNGAGKTTLINILVGIGVPTTGKVYCNNKNINKLGKRYLGKIGYMPQAQAFYPSFTGYEYLHYMGVMKGLARNAIKGRAEKLLEMVNLTEHRDKRIGSYSGGMKQRIGIAQALLNDPELLILDEPTAGLDPKERNRFRNILSKLSRDRIILLATHIVSDVEYLADKIIFIKEGKLICNENPDKLLSDMQGMMWKVEIEESSLDYYTDRFAINSIRRDKDKLVLRIMSDNKPDEQSYCDTVSLEDVYLSIFGTKGKNDALLL